MKTFYNRQKNFFSLTYLFIISALFVSRLNAQSQIQISTSTGNASTCTSSDGSIYVSASGGDGSNYYYFSLSNGQNQTGNNVTFNGLSYGSYTVTVYDNDNQGDGYSNTSNPSVGYNSCGTQIQISTSTNNASTCTSSDGSIYVSASGGDGSNYYYFYLSNGQSQYGNNVTFSGLSYGSYTLTVYDNDNQGDGYANSAYPSVSYNSCGTQIQISTSPSNASTCTSSDGSVYVSASGGDGSNYYYFYFSNGQSQYGNNVTFSGLSYGSYGVTVYDNDNTGDGYSNTASPYVNYNSCGTQIQVYASPSNASTCNSSDGSIYVSASGGDGSNYYYFYLSNGQSQYGNNVTFSGLSYGSYGVTVYDNDNTGDGYSNTASPYVSYNSCGTQIQVYASPSNASTCNSSDGSIYVSASGGDGSNYYYFYLSNGQSQYGNNVTFSGLSYGSYTVTVYDNDNQGDGYSNSASPYISYNSCGSGISASVTGSSNETCPGRDDGSITVYATGGDGSNNYYAVAYLYGGTTYQSSNSYGSNSITITGLPYGEYYYVYVYDANNPNDGYAAYLYPYTWIYDNYPSCGSQIQISTSPSNASSCNSSDGSIYISASGGDGSNYYYFYLSNGQSQYGNNVTFSGLSYGNYSVTVYDNDNQGDGFSNSTSTYISYNSCGTQIQISTSPSNASTCTSSDGSIYVYASGGDGSNYYYFYLSNGQSQYGNYVTFSGLSYGSYTVTVYDNDNQGDGYSNSASPYVSYNNCGTQIQISPSETDETCNNGNGSISISASGGDGNNYYYFYIYNNNNGSSYSNYAYGSTSFSGLTAGNYSITVDDGYNTGDGYGNTSSITVNDNTSGCYPINIYESSVSNDYCGNNSGSITAYASGGDGNYNFSISPNYGTVNASGSNVTFSNLPGNNYYTIYVQDNSNDNSSQSSIYVSLISFGDNGSYSTPSISYQYGPLCANPNNEFGGSNPFYQLNQSYPYNYSYSWAADPSGVSATLASPNGTGTSVSWNAAGTGYIDVTVTDDNGCSASAQLATTIGGGAPAITPSAGACTNSTVTYSSSTGYTTYSWSSDGAVSLSNSGAYQQQVTYNSGTAGQTGDIYLSVTDQGGCSATASLAITINDPASGQITGPGAACSNQTAYAYTVTSGGSNYMWLVDSAQSSNNGAIVSGQGTNAASVTWTTAGTTGAGTGYLSVTFTDANGCYVSSGPESFPINEVPVSNPNIDNAPTTVCANTPVVYYTDASYTTYVWSVDVGATVLAGGGSSDDYVSVSWSAGGTGDVSVAHDNGAGCSGNAGRITVTIKPSPVVPAFTVSDSNICAYDSASVIESGIYHSYSWSNGDTTSHFYTNQPGNYSLTVTDANGCSASVGPVHISVNASPNVTIDANHDTLSTSHFTSYQWLINDSIIPGANMQDYIATEPGNYSVYVVDAKGCAASSSLYDYSTGIHNLAHSNISIWSTLNRFFVDFTQMNEVDATIDVYNLLGQKLCTDKYTTSTLYSKQINSIEVGYIIVQVKNNSTVTTKKVLISNDK